MYVNEREKLINTYKEILIHKQPSMSELELLKSLAAFTTGLDVANAYYQFDDVDEVVESFKANNEIIIN